MKILEDTKVGVGGEIQLTDALDELLISDGLHAVETNASVYDCGNKHGFLLANVALGMKDPEMKLLLENFFKI
jgi:UTP--glucose-1-phosphate uridylyltransferase